MPTQPRLLAYVAEAALGECAIWRWASYGSKRAYDEATLHCSRYKAIAIQPTSSQNAFHVRSWIATLVSLACTVPTAEPQQRHTRSFKRAAVDNNCPAGQTNILVTYLYNGASWTTAFELVYSERKIASYANNLFANVLSKLPWCAELTDVQIEILSGG